MILNANPVSRRKVEEGEFCLRVNENKIDLNRNWDAHWEESGDQINQDYSGKKSFSESETRYIRDSLAAFQPLVFVTIHSGVLGMYTPFAYSQQEGTYNEDNMKLILQNLN